MAFKIMHNLKIGNIKNIKLQIFLEISTFS